MKPKVPMYHSSKIDILHKDVSDFSQEKKILPLILKSVAIHALIDFETTATFCKQKICQIKAFIWKFKLVFAC